MDRSRLVARIFDVAIWACLVVALALLLLLVTAYRVQAQAGGAAHLPVWPS
ncbi:MAG: hypothetical protein IT228_09435 [Flavobacteriales bacterium]|nr:hypothetical protein [Flavobacteriales bacterium]MCC6577549.1 hypothetical protein [Flavobacteriales bacterium]NUQ16312.1 hypothetical protein [Flavobacteriales bacterium]